MSQLTCDNKYCIGVACVHLLHQFAPTSIASHDESRLCCQFGAEAKCNDTGQLLLFDLQMQLHRAMDHKNYVASQCPLECPTLREEYSQDEHRRQDICPGRLKLSTLGAPIPDLHGLLVLQDLPHLLLSAAHGLLVLHATPHSGLPPLRLCLAD